MSPLAIYLSTAMRVFEPPAHHRSFEWPMVTSARYDAIAEDIAQVAEEDPVVDGDAARTGLVLVAVAKFESSYAEDVDSCTRHGGNSDTPAWSLWQVQGAHDELCSSRLDAARIARRMIGTSLVTCAREPEIERLAWYTDGRCGSHVERSRWRYGLAARYWKKHAIRPDR